MSKKFMVMLLCLCLASGAYAQLPVTESLIVHLRADSLTGLSDGDPVTVWVDSAQDDPVDGTVSDVGSGTPEYKADVLLGRPVVRFNGAEALSSVQFAIPDVGAGATCVMVCTGDKTTDLFAPETKPPTCTSDWGILAPGTRAAVFPSLWTFARSRVRQKAQDFGSTTDGPWPAIPTP